VLWAWLLCFRVSKQENNRDVESKSDRSDSKDMPQLVDYDEDELILPVVKSLVIRCTLQVQIKEDGSDQQRKNIFHTRCYIQNNVCNLIINSESCANIVSTTFISKPNLCIIKHVRPYRL